MEGWRILAGTGTGAVLGIIVVAALSWTLRLIRRPALAQGDAARPGLALSRGTKGAIFLVVLVGYASIGILHHGTTPPPPAPPAAAPAITPSAAPAQIEIGGVALAFEPPPGYCLYPSALLQTVVAQQARINPDNAIDTVIGNCDELNNAVAKQTRVRDFGILMTPKAELEQDIGAAALAQFVASNEDSTTVRETLDQRLAGAESRLRLSSFSTLGVIDRDRNAYYFGYLSRTKTESGEFDQACVMALTTIKRRLVSYYLYSDYSRDARPVLLALLQRAKAGVADLEQRNNG